VPNYNFADQYKVAGLAPGPEIIRLRQKSFDKLRKDIDITTILNLTRLYFGLPVPSGTDWFRDAFAEDDASFSMIDNEREASVLSGCLLAAALEDDSAIAGLALVVTAVDGVRNPLVFPELIETARQVLAAQSIAYRQNNAADVSEIKQPAKSKVGALADAFMATPDWDKVGEVIKVAGSESYETSKALASQILAVLTPLANQVQDLREEVSMLWWYIGGWSRALNKPFAELDLGLAALMAGLDLAHLVQGENGPVSAPAILQRLVIDSHPVGDQKISLTSAVNELPPGTFDRLAISTSIGTVSDLCPVLTALAKADEIGNGHAWHLAFNKATGLDATLSLFPLALAMQVYHESLLFAQID
jgi:hypothetical protein